MKRIEGWRPTAVRSSRFRWEGHVRADLGEIKTRNWRKIALDREKHGRLSLSRSKLTKSCSAKRRRSFVQLESSFTHVSLPVTKEKYMKNNSNSVTEN